MKMAGFKDLKVYRMAYKLAMEIYEITKSFPKEEVYSLTDLIRRSTRSICTNIGEGYRKRIYPKHFVTKMTDADGECTETMIWLDFSLDCGLLNNDIYESLTNRYMEVGKMLDSMWIDPEKFKTRS
jgi:four helix bundle protein